MRSDIGTIAQYFSVPAEKLSRLAAELENSEHPGILLLQNTDCKAPVAAAVLFTSTWSKSYLRFGIPYGKVYRDFYYQVMFSALANLAETGCDKLHIDNPLLGKPWREDAYVCLLEASKSIQSNFSGRPAVFLQEGTYDPRMPKRVESEAARYDLQIHRPIGIQPHIREGLNMRDVFIESASR